MFFNCKNALPTSALLALSALALACGGDDSGSGVENKLDGGGGTIDGGGGDAGTGTTVGETVQYNGTLVSILAVDTTMKIPTSHPVELLDNTTGKPFSPPITTTSATDTGVISIKAPKQPFMVKVTGVGPAPVLPDQPNGSSTYDAVIVNNYPTLDPLIRISSAGTLVLAEKTGRFTSKLDRAALGATVYWTQGGVRKGTVGCAKVYLDGATAPDVDQDQRYNGASGLPGPITCPADATDCTPITQTLTSGRFYIANIKTGAHTIKVSLDDLATTAATTSIVVPYARSEASSPTKAVIVQVGIDIEAAANPTPATCK